MAWIKYAGLALGCLLLTGCGSESGYRLTVNQKNVDIELAATADSRYQGLSDRGSLCSDCGMLFVFPQATQPAFVMRRMNFDLDIIWIKDYKITAISKNLSKDNQKIRYQPPSDIDMVLEVNAGFADKNGLSKSQPILINDMLKNAIDNEK